MNSSMNSSDGDRIAMVYISSVIFSELLTPVSKPRWLASATCIEGLPAGAELIEAAYDHWTDCVRLTFRHDSFEAVKNVKRAPVLRVTFQQDYDSSQGRIVFNGTQEVE